MPPNWRGGNERRYFRSGQIESWTTAALGNAAPEENRGLSPWLLSCGAGVSEVGLEKIVKLRESSCLLWNGGIWVLGYLLRVKREFATSISSFLSLFENFGIV